jgi:hypothetical protein
MPSSWRRSPMAERKNGAGQGCPGCWRERRLTCRPSNRKRPRSRLTRSIPSRLPRRGAGGVASRKPKGADARTAKQIKGRTIYLPDDLFERIIVQAQRKRPVRCLNDPWRVARRQGWQDPVGMHELVRGAYGAFWRCAAYRPCSRRLRWLPRRSHLSPGERQRGRPRSAWQGR